MSDKKVSDCIFDLGNFFKITSLSSTKTGQSGSGNFFKSQNKKRSIDYNKEKLKERVKQFSQSGSGYKDKEFQKNYLKEYKSRPEIKEREKNYNKEYKSRPEIKQKIKEYKSRPEIKEREKIYNKEKYKRKLAAEGLLKLSQSGSGDRKEYMKEYNKEYYSKNKEKNKERAKEYYKRNYNNPETKEKQKEKQKKYSKKYYSRPEIKEKQKEYLKEYHKRKLAAEGLLKLSQSGSGDRKEYMKEYNKEYYSKPEIKQKLKENNVTNEYSPQFHGLSNYSKNKEIIKKRSKENYKRKLAAEGLLKLNQSRAGTGFKTKNSKTNNVINEETKKRLKEFIKRKLAAEGQSGSGEKEEKKREYMKEYNSRPEVKEKKKKFMKKFHSKPENQEKKKRIHERI